MKESLLTLQQLNDMKPHTIFARGKTVDGPGGCNINNTGKTLRWMAIRGNINDWTIYIGLADEGWDWIKDYGVKVYSEQNIKNLVPCEEEAFKMYRY